MSTTVTAPTLLHIDASPRPDSVTRSLTAEFVSAWQGANPSGRVLRHDLAELDLPHLGATELAAWFEEEPGHPAAAAALARSERLVADVLAADVLVIGAPMWNFGVPSSLKAWIDHIVRGGRTIGYGPEGPRGLLDGPDVVVVTGRGSDFRPGSPFEAYDFQEPYLRHLFTFLGARSVEFVHADHQGPNWPDGADVVEHARTDLRARAATVARRAA